MLHLDSLRLYAALIYLGGILHYFKASNQKLYSAKLLQW